MIALSHAFDERPELVVREQAYAGPFGAWVQAFCEPSAALAPFVEQLWSSEGRLAAGLQRERILPRFGYELIVNLAETNALYAQGDPQRPQAYETSWLSGLQQGPLLVGFPSRVHVVGARLKPEGALALVGGGLAQLAGRVPLLESVLGPDARRLREALGEAPSARRRFALLTAALEARLARGARPDARVVHGLALLRASRGRLRIEELGRRVGLSPRHLIARFRDEVGLPPKALARVIRFHGAILRLQRTSDVPWAELAAECGFSDQAHLIREFQAFSGATPTEFLRKRTPDGEAMTAGEPA